MNIQINELHGVGIHDKICVIKPKVEMTSTLDPNFYNPNYTYKNPRGPFTNAFVIKHIFT
jgi:hypothetical protein